MATLTIPLGPATEAALDEIAAAPKRAKADVAAEALADYVRQASEFESLVREDCAAGRTFTHEEVTAGARAIIGAAKAHLQFA